MMDLSQIQDMSRKAARKAAREKRIPLMVEAEDLMDNDTIFNHIRQIPFLGGYLPKGYERVDELFVDMSGFGSDNEPALSLRQFLSKVMEFGPGHAYNFSEQGQFQGYVTVSRKILKRG
jgi:hypothetical protein